MRDALESTTAEAVEQSFAQQRAVNDDLIRANSARVALDALYPRERRRVSLLPRPINDESLLQKVKRKKKSKATQTQRASLNYLLFK